MRTSVLRAAVLALATTLLAGGLVTAAAPTAPAAVSPAATTFNTFQDVPVRGTYAGGVFRGRVDITNFKSVEGQLYAIGRLTGRVLDAEGDLVGRVTDKRVRLPVQLGGAPAAAVPAGATCEVLDLTLGPLDLDLLGLQVHLNRIVLVITAEPGPGNLLGNLLCAITGLLDVGGPLSGVLAQLLNVVRQLVNLFG